MKAKTLFIFLLILAVLTAAVILIIRPKAPERPGETLGTLLLEDLPVNEITSIGIEGPDGSVSLMIEKDGWVVENRFGYPADFSKITDLVRTLKEVKVGRQFEASEGTLKRLLLKAPGDPGASRENKGTRIVLKGENNQDLASILLGETRKMEGSGFPDGQYVRLGKDSKVYLIDKHFSPMDAHPSAWLDKSLAKVAAQDIRRIECLEMESGKILYELERSGKGRELGFRDLHPELRLKKSSLDQLAGALASLQMEDVVDPRTSLKSIGLEFPHRLEYHLFNGMVYRVFPRSECAKDEACHLRLDVDYVKPASEVEEKTEVQPSEEKAVASEKTPEEYELEAENLNKRFGPWTYVIPKWQHVAFITNFEQLLDQSEAGEAKK